MSDQRNLSHPITMRLPQDILAEIEQIAAACDKTRSWVFVRALKTYLAAEGREIIEIAQARQQIENGESFDLDDVLAEVDDIVKGAAA
ncbi:Ribbon-helix-helix protein, copG family [Agrobacterium sp. DSM 25558]|nr:ribbon-helix-helix protein, CopG family [Agrobacterium sp. DSM 25558]SCX28242.1 Ribbon-helix-helix protein, copG family [Agrobacterium sp. DSM 25558]